MSIELMTLVMNKSKTKREGRLVLLSLADNASDEGICWPSVATIARKANVGQDTARLYIKALEAVGVLSVQARIKEGGRQSSNEYSIDRKKIGSDSLSSELLKELKPPSHRKERLPPDGVTPSHPPLMASPPPPLMASEANHH